METVHDVKKKKKKNCVDGWRKPVAQVLILPLSFEIESQPHACTRTHNMRVFTYLRIHAVLSLSIHLFNYTTYTIVVRSGAERDVGYGREIERESGKGRKHDPMKP